MAIKATVFKANLQIANMDRYYYADHALTLALHPSETEERLMVRLLAFALYATASLAFARGISSDEEPDIWDKDLTGALLSWIEVGLPDERILRKACGRSQQVVLVSYGRAAPIWWNDNHDKLQRLSNLTVLNLPAADTLTLAKLAHRSMQLQCTIQEGQVLFTSDDGMVEIAPVVWQGHLPTAQN